MHTGIGALQKVLDTNMTPLEHFSLAVVRRLAMLGWKEVVFSVMMMDLYLWR